MGCRWEKAVEEPRRRRGHCQHWRNCRGEMECAHLGPRLWLTVLRNWRRSYAPESNLLMQALMRASFIKFDFFFGRCILRLLFFGQPFWGLPISCRGFWFIFRLPFSVLPISSRPFFVQFGRSFSDLPTPGLPFSAPPAWRALGAESMRQTLTAFNDCIYCGLYGLYILYAFYFLDFLSAPPFVDCWACELSQLPPWWVTLRRLCLAD